MASDHDACGLVPFEAPHRAQSCLEAPVVSFDPIVGVLGGVVECSWQVVSNDSDEGVGPVSGDLSRLATAGNDHGKERCRGLQVTLFRQEHVDDLPYWSTAR